jgi:ABC-type transport system involved in multi-copper enzyme maturation permease subunit
VEGIDNGRRLALGIGAAYVLVGLLGFAVTGFDDFAGPTNEKLLGIFGLNPLHNVVHLLIGFGGLALWRRRETAKAYGAALVAGYGATFLFGLYASGRTDAVNFLSLNAADNGLHLFSALAGVAILALVPKATAAVTSERSRTTV